MIEEVTRFKTDDGTIFKDLKEAQLHERMVAAYKQCLEILGDVRPDGNGGDYVQHTAGKVGVFIENVSAFLRMYVSLDTALRWNENPRGIVGRYLDDGGSHSHKFGSRLYGILSCIDSQNREWGQQYFVRNPNESAVAK